MLVLLILMLVFVVRTSACLWLWPCLPGGPSAKWPIMCWVLNLTHSLTR